MFTHKALMIFLALFLSGCVTSESIRDSAITTTGCSLHTSIACAMQSAAVCVAPALDANKKWKAYGRCLIDRSKACAVKGLAKCGRVGVATAVGLPVGDGGGLWGAGASGFAGTPGHPAGTMGLDLRCDLAKVDLCMAEADFWSESEAVENAARCWRDFCGADDE